MSPVYVYPGARYIAVVAMLDPMGEVELITGKAKTIALARTTVRAIIPTTVTVRS